MLFVGSCFADNIGKRFKEEQFRATVNPFGVMYNPASILHTVERCAGESYDSAVFTLGTNHVYIEKATGEIVDNCRKRPQKLFTEKELSIDECCTYLQKAVKILRAKNPQIHIIITVSPIRYAKYGYHESKLSKAILLLSANKLVNGYSYDNVVYFPAYEIVDDELRDYRFYKSDMLHPTDQTVEYIWERLQDTFFSKETLEFLAEWKPIKEALGHKPFHPESEAYKQFMISTKAKIEALKLKFPNMEL